MNTPGEQQFCVASSHSNSASANCSIVSAAGSQASRASSTATASGYAQTDTVVQRSTPILFSTNRGLHLRVNKPLAASTASSAAAAAATTSTAGAYDIRFCDLERWSTNRANTVSLEETVVSARTFTVAIPPSQRGSFIPVKQRSSVVRFHNTLTSFDETE